MANRFGKRMIVAGATSLSICALLGLALYRLRILKPHDSAMQNETIFEVPFTWDGKELKFEVLRKQTGELERDSEAGKLISVEAGKSLPIIIKQFNLRHAKGTIQCRLVGKPPLLRASCEDGSERVADEFDPSASTPIQVASATGDVNALRQLIKSDADANATDQHGNTPLMRSSQVEDTEAMKFLVASGAKVDARNEEGKTAVRIAVDHANLPAIRLLIESGADINIPDKKNWTPLMNASSPEIAHALIVARTNVNARNDDGETALMIAAQFGSADVIKVLLAAHADPRMRSNAGHTALDLAEAARRENNIAILQYFRNPR